MYLHLGKDIAVPDHTVIGIFDLDTSTLSKHTRAFLTEAEKAGRVVTISNELPKSAVVCLEEDGQVVYISQISTQTLLRRSQGEPLPGSVL